MQVTKTSWQQQLTECVKDVQQLLEILSLTPAEVNLAANTTFPLRVPRSFINRMEPQNPRDPLLLQVLPVAHEDKTVPGFFYDPLHEKDATKTPGLLHKYHGRVLLITTGTCAINCRYCFRRHFPYRDNSLRRNELTSMLDYIEKDTTLHEVILSGGDPLVLKDEALATFIHELAAIKHLKYFRIHTRLPIVIPDRVTETFIAMLTSTRLKSTVVIHCNHPNEINHEVAAALNQLTTQGISVLNQSVLLKDINDNPDTLLALSHSLYENGVIPYYLHLLDPIQGTAHFAVSEERAKAIMQHLRDHLPGYLVPRLVKEVAGAKSKIIYY